MEGLFKVDKIHCFPVSPGRSGMSFWANFMIYHELMLKFHKKYEKQENSLGGCYEKLEKMVPNVKT